MTHTIPEGFELTAAKSPETEKILTPPALQFIIALQREFNSRRAELLKRRADRQVEIDAGILPTFLPDTAHVRRDLNWKIAPTPADLQKRRVEITGPTDRKMLINALNSGASVFMADFEDANAPTWQNMIEGQANLGQAIDRSLTFTHADGRQYRLNDQVAVLMVRPRGWHLPEKHLIVDGEPISGSLFDFGLYFYHNARKLLEKGTGPYFYLPKLESHLEARLWNDVFQMAQDSLGIPRGSIRATVLIETILAAFEMDEILYELREHAAGLNAGRWDYMFSIIKKFRNRPEFLFPDRAQVTMTVPFMRAYTNLLVQTCHKRGAHAIGGMAAYIPSRKNPEINEIALTKVRDDKLRESGDGFDGTWVAHPDLVHIAMQIFDKVLGDKAHQKEVLRQEVEIEARSLIDFRIPGGEITESGLRTNISVALQYLESWLRGVGAAAIYNLMEDAATAEISRAQVWQWTHHPSASLADGRKVSLDLYRAILPQEMNNIRSQLGEKLFSAGKFDLAARLFDRLVMEDHFSDFLTLLAYEHME